MIRRFLALTLAVAGLAATASAYYHFLHYASGSNAPIPEKFDLSSLRNKTLYYFVSDSGPTRLAAGDSFAAVLSQIRLAGQTWNDVGASDLRVAYGGLFTLGVQQSTPHMEVVFEDVPPGVLGFGGPTSRSDIASGPDGPFVPILRSTVILPRDLSAMATYATVPNDTLAIIIHEMGHALGLQHTLTSSAMSTEVTRATTRAKPLVIDDIAGLAVLYPTASFAARFGSLSGRVTMAGNGVHMASVVALTTAGYPVSALTNPDGSYRIDGVPPGEYYVYAHALPPSVQQELGPSEIVLPLDSNGQSIPAGAPFRTQFYPGAQDPSQATRVEVKAGTPSTEIDFAVDRRGTPQLHSVTTYSFPDGYHTVHPAYENISVAGRWMVATGAGVMPNGAPAPGIAVSVLADVAYVAPDGVYPYYLAPQDYLQVNFLFTPFTGAGPRHLLFSTPDEVYVLPAGTILVNQQPPWIDTVTPDVDGSGNRIVKVTGTNLTGVTRILFDGLPATVNRFDEQTGSLVVTPPPGASGYRANVVAFNSDGQTSLFLQDPPTYTYDTGTAPLVSLSVASLPAGSEAMIDVNGVNTSFVDGQVRLGFGSSDVWVKRLWVLSPTHLRAEVVVSSSAPAGNTLVSVTSGFQVISQPLAFQILPSSQGVVASSDLVNAFTKEAWVYPGATAALVVVNLPADANPNVFLNDALAQVVSTGPNVINFLVPANITPGLAVLRVQVGSQMSNPIAVVIDPPPPGVAAVLNYGVPLDVDHPAYPGDQLTVIVTGLADAGATVPVERLHISLGGVVQQLAGSATPAPDLPGQHQIQFYVSDQVTAGPQPLTVAIDYRTSAPYTIPVHGK